MPLEAEEDTFALLERLLQESRDKDAATVLSSQAAIDESRRLLAQVARDHPDIA